MKKPELATVKLTDLVLNKGTQMRVSLNQKWIEELREKIKSLKDRKPEEIKPEDKIDPIKVVRDSEGHLYPWDGFHRINAHKAEKVSEIDIEITNGDLALARRLAYGANARHGEKRSRADIKFIAEKILADKEIMKDNPSNMELSRITGISEFTFRKMRPVQAGEAPRTATTKSGGTRKVSTKNIGKPGSKTAKTAKTTGKGAAKGAAAKAAEATPSPATGAETPTTGKATPQKVATIDDLDKDLQRAIRKITGAIGGEDKTLESALVDGSLGLSRRDIMDWQGTSDERIRKLAPLIVENRMKPNAAIRVIDNPVDGKTKVGDLVIAQIAHNGWLEEKIEGEDGLVLIVIDTRKHKKPEKPGSVFIRKPSKPKKGAAPEAEETPDNVVVFDANDPEKGGEAPGPETPATAEVID